MNGFMLLMAADPAKWIAGLAPLVIFVVFILFVVGSSKQAQRRAASKPKQASPKFAERSRSGVPPTRPQPVRNDEIQEFLRRAAGQRKEQANRPEASGAAANGRRGASRRRQQRATRHGSDRRRGVRSAAADIDALPGRRVAVVNASVR